MEPNNAEVLDSYAALLLDMDEFDTAKQISFHSLYITIAILYSRVCTLTAASVREECECSTARTVHEVFESGTAVGG